MTYARSYEIHSSNIKTRGQKCIFTNFRNLTYFTRKVAMLPIELQIHLSIIECFKKLPSSVNKYYIFCAQKYVCELFFPI